MFSISLDIGCHQKSSNKIEDWIELMIHKLIGEYTLIVDGFHSFTEESEGIFLVPTDKEIMASCKVNLNQKSVTVEINNLN